MRAPTRWTLLACLAAFAADATAQVTRCGDNLTFGECFRLYQNSPEADSVRKTAAAAEGTVQEQVLQTLETGVDLGGAATALANFLPLLNLTGLTGESGGSSRDSRPIALGGVPPLPDALPSAGVLQPRAQAETVPALAEPLRRELESSGRAARIAELEDELDGLADSAVSLAYAFQRFGFGRDFTRARGRLDALTHRLLSDAEGSSSEAKAMLAFFNEHGGAIPAVNRFDEIADVALRARVKALWEARAAESALSFARYNQLRAAYGLDRFADLVNNQPQLHLTVKRLVRDPLVGAEATDLRIVYESSGRNLNDFESRFAGNACPAATEWDDPADATAVGRASTACLEAFRRYVADDAATRGERYALGLEYGRIEDLDITLPADAIALHVPGADRLAATVSYGRYVRGGGSTRFDVNARYDSFSGDALRADGWTIALVLTQRIAGLSLPLSVVYRSGGEFESDAGDQILGLVGLDFDMFRDLLPPTPATGVQVVPLAGALDLPDLPGGR